MTSELGNSNSGTQRTRRNTMKMGAVLAFAALGSVSKADPASANCGNNGKLVGNGCAKGNATNCFLKGTTIRTVSGDRKIEDLAVGDLLPTMFGGLRPVQWIGRYPIKKAIPLSRVSRTRCRFVSHGPLSVPSFRMPTST
jgi:Hint domain